MSHCVFEYLYRDAGNFKSFGAVLLDGEFSPEATSLITDCLDSGEFFVAEQVGLPALYEPLWNFSGGPTENDHAFHEFVGVRPATEEEINSLPNWGSVARLLAAFAAVERRWDCRLSPH